MSILGSSGLTLYLAGVLTPILIGLVVLHFTGVRRGRGERAAAKRYWRNTEAERRGHEEWRA